MGGLNFGMMGAAGFVAPRHMKAIQSVGGVLMGACDPYDGVGALDRYFPEYQFFTEVERTTATLRSAANPPVLRWITSPSVRQTTFMMRTAAWRCA